MPTGPVYRRFDGNCLSEDDKTRLADAVSERTGLGHNGVTLLPPMNVTPRFGQLMIWSGPRLILHPELNRMRLGAEQLLGRIVRMSGSGSSLFTLFDDQPAAQHAAAQISAGQASPRPSPLPLAPAIDDDLR